VSIVQRDGRLLPEHDVVVLRWVLQLSTVRGRWPGIRKTESFDTADIGYIVLRHHIEAETTGKLFKAHLVIGSQ
jgi:hypothetical protein